MDFSRKLNNFIVTLKLFTLLLVSFKMSMDFLLQFPLHDSFHCLKMSHSHYLNEALLMKQPFISDVLEYNLTSTISWQKLFGLKTSAFSGISWTDCKTSESNYSIMRFIVIKIFRVTNLFDSKSLEYSNVLVNSYTKGKFLTQMTHFRYMNLRYVLFGC